MLIFGAVKQSIMDHSEINVEYEYELIDFAWSMEYDFEEGETGSMVRDEGETPEEEAALIEFDENGIPKGQSKKEIKMREKIIKDFYAQWIASNPTKKVRNENLKVDIYVKFASINETFAKAARTYKSTCAVFRLSEILRTSILVKELDPKNNKNQRPYEKMLQMRAFDNVKLIVGLQRSTQEHVQYSITVPE